MSFKIGDYVIVEDGTSYYHTTEGSYGKVVTTFGDSIMVDFSFLASKTTPNDKEFCIFSGDVRLMTKLDKYLAGIGDEI